MRIGIGIDTGGTSTDIVAYDYDTEKVLAKNKTLTTKQDLTLCISRSLDFLPPEMLEAAVSISLSTTLATNACVEDRGGRGRLVLMGVAKDILQRTDAANKYGIDAADALCMDLRGKFDGSYVEEPNWEKLLVDNYDWFFDAQSLALSEVNALRNGAIVEKHGREFFSEKLGVPIVLASDLAGELNVLERGATALLNARLLPVISDFVAAVTSVLEQRNLDIPVMILRSDGSLMSKDLSRERPVETILSGPAASVIGGRGVSDCKDCLIIDIGGTTTDISIVEKGAPVMTDSIKIGGWKTQVKGVFIDTYGLGGDSRVWIDNNKLTLGTQRVVPLCILAAHEPQAMESLEGLVERHRGAAYPTHEFLYILKQPESLEGYTEAEKRLLDTLADGPVMLGDERLDMYALRSKRLEDEGVLMRCGVTPTDIMHLRGDFNRFERRASECAIEHFAQNLYRIDTPEKLEWAKAKVCDDIYMLAKKRLYDCIMMALFEYRYPELCQDGISPQVKGLLDANWNARLNGEEKKLLDLNFDVSAALVGIGAPTHVLLPDVAEIIGAECIIPEHAEVANAIGTAIANISVVSSVAIDPKYDSVGITGYIVRAPEGNIEFELYDQAAECALEKVREKGIREARLRGALGELKIRTELKRRDADVLYGDALILDLAAYAYVSGHLGA